MRTDGQRDMTKLIIAIRNFGRLKQGDIKFYAHRSVHRESILKMFQQDNTFFCTVFYSLQTALPVSGETFTHHQELE
jgi:predicted RNase H-related nuclease YkuK (DUF458 family)